MGWCIEQRNVPDQTVPCFCCEIRAVYDGILFRSAGFATGNTDVLMCSVCNSSSCISHMLLNRLLEESIKFTFKNKCCLNKEKRANATTRQALCYLVCYINVYITAFYVMHNLQRQKSYQEHPLEMLTFISVTGSNKRNYQQVVADLVVFFPTCKMEIYTEVRKLICLKRK